MKNDGLQNTWNMELWYFAKQKYHLCSRDSLKYRKIIISTKTKYFNIKINCQFIFGILTFLVSDRYTNCTWIILENVSYPDHMEMISLPEVIIIRWFEYESHAVNSNLDCFQFSFIRLTVIHCCHNTFWSSKLYPSYSADYISLYLMKWTVGSP